MEDILKIENLKKHFFIKDGIFRGKFLRAVNNISFSLKKGETLAVVGESGSGKTTIARLILKIEEKTDGLIYYNGMDIDRLSKDEERIYRENVKIIFQDPYSSLNPRWKAGRIIGESLYLSSKFNNNTIKGIVMEKLAEVGLSSEAYNKYPHEFSGGQRQRIAILRAVITSPLVVVCDEPTSALDVSVRAQIINLLIDLQKKYNMSYMFISHDLGIVNYISDRIIVVYSGQIMEIITSDAMYTSYKHPYTDVLIKSMPSINVINDKKETPIKGEVTLSFEEIRGCPYKTRCFYARKDCDEVNMELIEIGKNHFTACPFFI